VRNGLLSLLEGRLVVVRIGLVLLRGLQTDPLLVVWAGLGHRDNDDVEVLVT
jgi:hypothetical protein